MSTLNVSEPSGPMYYRLRGASPFAGTTLGALLSWAAVAALAAVYAYADLYIKVVDKLSILILIVCAVAMGFAVAGVLRVTKVRNLTVIAIIAATSALLALYVSWAVWESAFLQKVGEDVQAWELFRRPRAVWSLAQLINEEGTFMLRDRAVKGTELWLAWGIEALTLVGCTLLIPLLTLRRMAFCESCGSWCEKRKNLARVRALDEDLLREHVENRDYDYLSRLGRPEENAPVFHSIELFGCPKCGQTNLLTVNRVTVTYTNGQRAENARPIVDRLWLNAAEAEVVLALPQRMMEAAAASPQPPQQTEAEANESATGPQSQPPASPV